MKSISGLLSLVVLGAVLLTGCTYLTPDETQENAPQQPAEMVFTAVQIKAQLLQAQPNLYKKQAAETGAGLPTATLNKFQAGLSLKRHGKYSQARDVFIAMSEKSPNLSGIWLQLGLITQQLGKQTSTDKEQAYQYAVQDKAQNTVQYLNKAIAANSLNYLAHNELAQVLRQQGQFSQALSHYELAIKSWPAFAQGYLNRGILYDLYMGKKSLALADYELYKALSNDNSRQLKGWIIDLQRQIKMAEQVTQTGSTL